MGRSPAGWPRLTSPAPHACLARPPCRRRPARRASARCSDHEASPQLGEPLLRLGELLCVPARESKSGGAQGRPPDKTRRPLELVCAHMAESVSAAQPSSSTKKKMGRKVASRLLPPSASSACSGATGGSRADLRPPPPPPPRPRDEVRQQCLGGVGGEWLGNGWGVSEREWLEVSAGRNLRGGPRLRLAHQVRVLVEAARLVELPTPHGREGSGTRVAKAGGAAKEVGAAASRERGRRSCTAAA